MGQRVTFKDRASRKNWHRVEFVNGWLTGGVDPTDGSVECGDGTAFPILLTLHQLAELLYRVKDAWFTGGSISFDSGFGIATLSAPTSSPSTLATKINSNTSNGWQVRGYCKKTPADQYTDAVYDAGFGYDYADITDKELGMWGGDWDGVQYSVPADHMINAFSYASSDPGGLYPADSNWWGLGAATDLFVDVYFGGRVAVVKLDPDDDFYCDTNQYFLEFEFFWTAGTGFVAGGTNIYNSISLGDWSATSQLQGCDYIIRMVSGDISCPIYLPTAFFSPSGVDVIHEAKEWWPYKDKAGDPAWDSTTGLPDNDGPLG